ncbi:hypothetical protein SLUN_01580 [Streptomyces lunaelactis]|uniref:Uncharacterized protein n=1 Tax=Streptomyces lunaelactis TaxID=1535768 RepID=A0A2R4SW88_9ACTN|nr:hypothetical protein SLUN_01580 [Streptomyces lunaelactis]
MLPEERHRAVEVRDTAPVGSWLWRAVVVGVVGAPGSSSSHVSRSFFRMALCAVAALEPWRATFFAASVYVSVTSFACAAVCSTCR